ncbi:MAG: anti-CBASS protein Acb1 family protein [Pikeienuella sp.]
MAKPHYRRTADGQTFVINDGLQNVTSGMGSTRDKGWQAAYTMPVDNPTVNLTAYKASRMIARAIDLPAEDACREWREWQAKGTDISKIEAEEARLGLQGKMFEARRLARLMGGGALMIGTGDKDLMEPLNPERIGKGGIKYLTILSRQSLNAGEIGRNPAEPEFGVPTRWSINGGETGALDIHPSRLVISHGVAPLADSQGYDAFDGWGGSVLPGMLDALRRVDEGAANVNSLLYEAKIDVVRIDGLMQKLQSGGQTYEAELLRRFTLAATAKGINGMLILDALEEYQQKSASFGGLPDVMVTFMQLASAAVGIPMTLFFMQSPGGLNSTGESDVRNYYDRVKVEQSLRMQPSMAVLDECLIRSALGSRPADVFYNWRPLWQPTAKERAETAKIQSEAMEKAVNIDAVSIEAAGKSLVNAFTESGAFPGLEAANEEFPVVEGDDGDDPDDGGTPIGDASPRTLYVRRDVLNGSEIIAWAKEQGFKTTLPEDDLHVTLMFSRRAVDWMKMGESWQSDLDISAGGARMMERFGDARVLLFASSELSWRHEQMKREGATWDHAEYQPHITISYDPEAPDIADIEPYRGEIKLGPEIFEEVNEKWLEGVTEE